MIFGNKKKSSGWHLKDYDSLKITSWHEC